MSSDSDNLFYAGSTFRVEFLKLPDGTMPARSFLDSIVPGNKQYKHRLGLQSIVELYANSPHGTILNREQFKLVDDGIYEFKRHQLRLFAFYQPGGRLILVDGVQKQSDDLDQADVKRAKRLRDEFVKRESAKARRTK
jgi:hypothetical protein